jgi:hypothetical protein
MCATNGFRVSGSVSDGDRTVLGPTPFGVVGVATEPRECVLRTCRSEGGLAHLAIGPSRECWRVLWLRPQGACVQENPLPDCYDAAADGGDRKSRRRSRMGAILAAIGRGNVAGTESRDGNSLLQAQG